MESWRLIHRVCDSRVEFVTGSCSSWSVYAVLRLDLYVPLLDWFILVCDPLVEFVKVARLDRCMLFLVLIYTFLFLISLSTFVSLSCSIMKRWRRGSKVRDSSIEFVIHLQSSWLEVARLDRCVLFLVLIYTFLFLISLYSFVIHL